MKLIYNQISYDIESFMALNTNATWIQDIIDFLVYWMDKDSDSLAVQTSGSTGIPKPITLSKDAMRTSAHITNGFFKFNESKTAVLCLPVKYIAGKMMLVRALEANMDLIIEEPSALPLSSIDRVIEFVAMTPFQLEKVLDDRPDSINSVRVILLGGGPVTPRLIEKLQKINTQCYLSYGMTETLTHIALKRINGPNKMDHFQVLDGFEIAVDDRGCLIIAADHIYNQRVITNDVVSLSGPKAFQWQGRHDHIINTGGIKINPETVENKIQDLMEFPFFIIGTPDDQLGEKVTLCLELKDCKLVDQAGLLNKIKSRLSKFENPRSILFFDCFLYTETGKIKRKQTLDTHS